MRTTLALLCVLETSLAGFAQDKNFDLSRYKFPDYKRHEMELNFNSSGSSQNYSIDQPGTIITDFSRYKNSNVRSNSYLNLGYQYEYFTRKRMDYIYSSLNGRYDLDKFDRQGEKTKESSPQMHGTFNGSSRYYLTEDKIFVEGLANLGFDYTQRKNTFDSNNNPRQTDNYESNSLNVSAGIGVGIGRIERVSDLWQAYYILEKLNGQKSLHRELQEKDVFEFARLASTLKNKRFFDARLRKIGELQSLDSLMQSQGLVSNGDIAYFTTLNDYWSYGNFSDRRSGRELKFQIMPEHLRDYSKSENTPSVSSATTNLVSKIQYDCSKQMNLYWERNFHIDVANSTLLASDGDVPDNYPHNLKSAHASLGFGFFPDSRTSFGLSGSYSGYEAVNSEGDNIMTDWYNDFNFHLMANYYLSPQLQISGYVNERYWFSDYRSMQRNDLSYSLGLRYAIF